MVSRLVEQENVGLEEYRTSESELHLPTTQEAADGLLLALIHEANGSEHLDALRLVSLNALVRDDELKDGSIFL